MIKALSSCCSTSHQGTSGEPRSADCPRAPGWGVQRKVGWSRLLEAPTGNHVTIVRLEGPDVGRQGVKPPLQTRGPEAPEEAGRKARLVRGSPCRRRLHRATRP